MTQCDMASGCPKSALRLVTLHSTTCCDKTQHHRVLDRTSLLHIYPFRPLEVATKSCLGSSWSTMRLALLLCAAVVLNSAGECAIVTTLIAHSVAPKSPATRCA